MHSSIFLIPLIAVALCSVNLGTAQGTTTSSPSAGLTASAAVQPPDFATMFTFDGGYKNIVTLKTVDGKRLFRMEGERCYVEGTFAADDPLEGLPTAWVLPGVTFARASIDDKFCASGTKTPVLLQKEFKKSFLGTQFRLGEFKWGRFAGTFEVK